MTIIVKDEDKIRRLIQKGYHVEIVNPYGNCFSEKYRVWQSIGWNELKTAVVSNNGDITALQG